MNIGIIIFIILYVVVGVMFVVEIIFMNCEHPEKYATFVSNVYGDKVNYYGGRSLWDAKWWPFLLAHKSLKE